MLVPLESAGTTLDVVFRTAVPRPSATDGGSGIYLRGVVLLHLLHPLVAVGHPVACRLVASSHHDERRMVAVLVNDAFRLLQQVLVNLLAAAKLHTVVGPRRTFGLQVDAHTVGSTEGSLGRTVAVEAHVVQTVLLALTEDAQPLRLVGGRIARQREAAVLHRAAQMERTAVDIELASLDRDVAHAEGRGIFVVASLYGQLVQVRCMLVPQPQVVAQV